MTSLGKYYAELRFVIKLLKSPDQRKHVLKWTRTTREDLFLKQKIPWLTFDAIDFLNTIPLKSKKVFEWGSGGSTLFWLKKGAYVISVEHDLQWYEKMKLTLPNTENVDYKLIEPEIKKIESNLIDPSDPENYFSSNFKEHSFYKYATIIDQFENDYFDVILIDGRARPSCIKHAVNKIKPGGLLILDNSDRNYYLSKTSQYIKNFQKEVYFGAVPLVPVFSETTIYKKTYSCIL